MDAQTVTSILLLIQALAKAGVFDRPLELLEKHAKESGPVWDDVAVDLARKLLERIKHAEVHK